MEQDTITSLLTRKRKQETQQPKGAESSETKMEKHEQCCVPGCGKSMEPLCRLPKDETQQRDWLRVISNPDLKTKSPGRNYEIYRICRKHFTNEAFHRLKYKNKNHGFVVKNNNIPTLHLPQMKEDLFCNNIDLRSSEKTSKVQTEALIQREYLKPAYEPVTYYKKNDAIQNSISDFFENVSPKMSIDTSDFSLGRGIFKSEHVDNVQMNLIEEESRESSRQTKWESFEPPPKIEEECIDFVKHVPDESERIGNTSAPNETKRQNQCCVVPECGELMKPLCRFPREETHQREWLKVIGNPLLKHKSHRNIYAQSRICRKHFTDEVFLQLNSRNQRSMRFPNKMPTLHLPVIKDEEVVPNGIDLDNSEPTLPVLTKQSKPPIHLPITYFHTKNKNIQNGKKIHKDFRKTCISQAKTGNGSRTYRRAINSINSFDNNQINLKKEKTIESYVEIEISDLHQPETFSFPSTIKEESMDTKSDSKLYNIDDEHVRVESELFGEHVSLKLQSYNENTRTVVENLINDILFNADNGMYD